MPTKSREETPSAHRFGQNPPLKRTTKSINISSLPNSPNRLVKKYRNPKFALLLVSDDHNHSSSSNNNNDKTTEKHPKPTHKPAHSSTTRPEKSYHEVTQIPAPIPDTGILSTDVSASNLPTHAATRTALQVPPASSIPASFIHPSTASFVLTPQSSVLTPSSTTSLASTAAVRESASRPHQLSITAIGLLAIGSACVLVGIFIVVRACMRPRRQERPRPSLPIQLEDAYPDDHHSYDEKARESPLFGGKERYSSQNVLNGDLYPWTQYPHSNASVTRPLKVAVLGNSYEIDVPYGFTPAYRPSEKTSVENRDQPSLPQSSGPTQSSLVFAPPVVPLQNSTTLSRVASRFSVASMSVYPTSPQTVHADGNIENTSKAFTADGHKIMKRASRAALRKSKSYAAGSEIHVEEGELAYAGADVSSPQFLAHFPDTPTLPVVSSSGGGGRTRIKSSYYQPGSYPRMSSVPSSLSAKAKMHETEIPAMPKSDSRRDRDTKALAAVLGFLSPPLDKMPPSPQPTIYPDDSLSVVDSRKPSKRSLKKPAPKFSRRDGNDAPPALPMLSPTMDTSTALGSLMLMDFGATNKSLSTLAGRLGENLPPSELGYMSMPMTANMREDRPPRVPSPPPLPSLTQMALEHSDPEAFANYKSPTYSIYGLYESDRKSRVSFHGRA